MKVVIQCAAGKQANAGYLYDNLNNRINFVSKPNYVPDNLSGDLIFKRPDDSSPWGITWREVLIKYNNSSSNPLNLLKAYELYKNPIYKKLYEIVGNDLYILSAGWGLIPAKFFTPYYDITFSVQAEKYKKRDKGFFNDFNMLEFSNDDLYFFGGKEYLKLFQNLTKDYQGKRIVYYNSKDVPESRGCHLIKYETRTKTNWHYDCVKTWINNLNVNNRSDQSIMS